MGWIATIIVGFIVGVLAKFLHPGKDNLGFIMTSLLGIGGAFLAGVVGTLVIAMYLPIFKLGSVV